MIFVKRCCCFLAMIRNKVDCICEKMFFFIERKERKKRSIAGHKITQNDKYLKNMQTHPTPFPNRNYGESFFSGNIYHSISWQNTGYFTPFGGLTLSLIPVRAFFPMYNMLQLRMIHNLTSVLV